jgi:hypothetical protein
MGLACSSKLGPERAGNEMTSNPETSRDEDERIEVETILKRDEQRLHSSPTRAHARSS